MIGQEENQDDVVLKVIDRRKFNPDGSLKEGVSIEGDSSRTTNPAPSSDLSRSEERSDVVSAESSTVDGPAAAEGTADDDLIGSDDPASFVNFLSTLATNAAAALGAVPHPVTGQRSVDLETGKYWLDVLGMLREKTKGNLHTQESHLLEGLLADLRMQYVTMVRATEEKLKAQAAKKFSGADILGKN
ncbi:MAG TPA: DUF1844 domain-containing protein [Pyrinomonadaceae bacterium]|nr:DUF1844 domain-containing protein [Pyrinomonadaceae bacterium]HMP64267.1 DUF1844 domain-containing protein [Pyrinomonadaceae bacterium]